MSDILSKLPLPHDRPVSGEDIIRELHIHLETLTPGTPDHQATLFELMRYYGLSGMVDESLATLETLLEAEIPVESKASAALVNATCIKRTGDFHLAALIYRRALSLLAEAGPGHGDPYVAYFAHNNLAYSLNQVGSFAEGETEARAATAVEPARHNAHKNLGVALEGLGRRVEAAHAFIAAVHAEPLDDRSLRHLETMLADHAEVLEADPALVAGVESARNARKRLFAGLRTEHN